MLVLPDDEGVLARQLGFAAVPYWKRLEAALKSVWGAFIEEEDDEAIIGVVYNTEITRWATISTLDRLSDSRSGRRCRLQGRRGYVSTAARTHSAMSTET